ncbi:hypothetical protein MLD38_012701 [Melastoma candidum]|uniref:Uncharacterized protein n=1 Tax=Melastoma candidum TaxID=119954 RepID=A0ACB9R8Z6_9MYRT|nr:hypothetical protein MLD38_012701 [Melastoma candidum]
MDVYSEIEEELAHRGHSYRLVYAKRWMNNQARAYLVEARWFNQKFIPPTDEYIATASMSIGFKMLMVHTLVGMGDLVMEDTFEWLSSNPRVLQSTASASRFINDIVGYKFEHERGHVASSIHCLVKQYGCTEHQAEDMLRKWIFDSWKDVNEACLMPLQAPMPVLERILNWLRSTSLFYDGIDNYTHSTTKLKDIVTAILIDPLPL